MRFAVLLVGLIALSFAPSSALAASVRQQPPAFFDRIEGGPAAPRVVPQTGPRVILPSPAGVPVTASPPAKSKLAMLIAPCNSAAAADSLSSRVALPLSHEEECALRPKDVFKECDTCPEMVVVPAGRFTMGSPETEKDRAKSEGPLHEVTIARPFAVGRFHVRVEQFAAFVADAHRDVGARCSTFEGGKVEERQGRSWRNPGFAQEQSHPAVCLSWNDAEAYVDWLSRKTGKEYRLLTEAEWEYAARARTEPGAYPRFWFGNEEEDLCRHGNGADEATKAVVGTVGWRFAPCDDGNAYTSPAGSFDPNDFGLYDMAGNAWQWTADCWNDSYGGAPSDGSARVTGDCSRRVIRGGAWSYHPGFLRAAARNWNPSGGRGGIIGLRVGRALTWSP
jgi:formylglycine-generating enzyme required for sulfatase activity